MRTIFDAIASVSVAKFATYGAVGALAGAVFTPLVIFLAMKLNYKRLRDIYQTAAIPETAHLYRLFAIIGAVMFAVIAASQPVLDAAGDNEIYIRGALVPVLMIIGIPFVRALKRLRSNTTR